MCHLVSIYQTNVLSDFEGYKILMRIGNYVCVCHQFPSHLGKLLDI